MKNSIGVYHLFGNNDSIRREFYMWCKRNDDFCDYDLDHLGIELTMPTINNTYKYFHFSMFNILDWLESLGYYIGIPLRGEFKFVSVVHLNTKGNVNQRPIYSNSGVKTRNRAYELGVINAIKHYVENKK